MTRTIFIAATLALAITLPTASARAQSIRTFVSTAGSDSNPCSITQPCRHFSAAIAVTSVGGEVDALDAGAYGSFTITGAITIEGQGWSYVAPPPSGNGITINAGSGSVTIRGVSLNGAGVSGGTNGIVFNSGGSLTVTNCVAQNFTASGTTGNGILIAPTSGSVSFAITNTIVSNNGLVGINYDPPSGSANAYGVIDHVTATNNQFGIIIYPINSSGSTIVALSNSVATNNSANGILAANGTGPLTFSIDNATVSGNADGIYALSTPKVLLGRSVITGSSTGVDNETSSNSFYTYQDNRINGNSPDISGTALNKTFTLQ
jgi:hypothetical protein